MELKPPFGASSRRQVCPRVPVMGSYLPYNPWEVSYTLPAVNIPPRPAVTRSHRTFRHPSPTIFPLFPLLPAELRVRIWSLAAPNKRVIEIRSWGSTRRYTPIKYSVHPHCLPAIFHVCRESRIEALRIYKKVAIGISAATRIEGQRYVDWEYHPANPNCRRRMPIGSNPFPLATPQPPTYVYISWEHDIIYLGPEFQPHLLMIFLSAQGERMELRGLRYLALDRKLWIKETGMLPHALWNLRKRNLSEIIVIPDDEKRCLTDRWYYGKHEITMRQPVLGNIRSAPEEWVWANSFRVTLEEWFGRLWKDHNFGERKSKYQKWNDKSGRIVDDEQLVKEMEPPKPPTVRLMSVTRNGQKMREYTDGVSDIKKAMGDMQFWKTWTPSGRS